MNLFHWSILKLALDCKQDWTYSRSTSWGPMGPTAQVESVRVEPMWGQLWVMPAPAGDHGLSWPAAKWGHVCLLWALQNHWEELNRVAWTAVPAQETCLWGLGPSQDCPLAPNQDWKWKWLPSSGESFKKAFRSELQTHYFLPVSVSFSSHSLWEQLGNSTYAHPSSLILGIAFSSFTILQWCCFTSGVSCRLLFLPGRLSLDTSA